LSFGMDDLCWLERIILEEKAVLRLPMVSMWILITCIILLFLGIYRRDNNCGWNRVTICQYISIDWVINNNL
jgi:hypothetical protein